MMRLMCMAFLALCAFSATAAEYCPDPDTTSLKDGVPPEPWKVNPFSDNPPQGESGTRFVRANILVAGVGQGVMCTYRTSAGDYSIWWQVRVKLPSRNDNNWIETQGGFVCPNERENCPFYVAI